MEHTIPNYGARGVLWGFIVEVVMFDVFLSKSLLLKDAAKSGFLVTLVRGDSGRSVQFDKWEQVQLRAIKMVRDEGTCHMRRG